MNSLRLGEADDQCFALLSKQTLLWYFVFRGKLYGAFSSRNAAYSALKEQGGQREFTNT